MRTVLAAIAAVAIVGCAGHIQQRSANPVATPTVLRVPVVRGARARVAAARPLLTPAPRSPSPSPSPGQSAATAAVAQVATATSRPTPTLAPTATLTQLPTPSASPRPSPSSGSAIVQLPPDAAPQITALHIDRTTVRGGDTVTGWIITSSNVASVEARIGYYSIPVPKVGEGRFALSYVVPHLPFFMHHTYDMAVIARNTAGVEAVRTIPIRIR